MTVYSSIADDHLHLCTAGTSLVLDLEGGTLPRVLHWGPELTDLRPDEVAQLRLATRSIPRNAQLDEPAQVAVLAEQSAGWLGRVL